MPSEIRAVDLFCGGGGTSKGLALALLEMGVPLSEVRLVAINHWDVAIATHAANHPWATHLCAKVEGLDPTEVVRQIGNAVAVNMAKALCLSLLRDQEA